MSKKKLGADVPEKAVNEWNDWCDERLLKRGEAAAVALRFFMAQDALVRELLMRGQVIRVDPESTAGEAGQAVAEMLRNVAQASTTARPEPSGKQRRA